MEYYFLLRSVGKANRQLGRCIRCRCADCGIFFLTDPRNHARRDLRCPFGCREAHCRARARERSRACYATEAGKHKKKLQNSKRSQRKPKAAQSQLATTVPPKVQPDEIKLAPEVIRYVGVVTSLIEGRRLSRNEVIELLRRALRQHSFARKRRIDYVVSVLNENPP